MRDAARRCIPAGPGGLSGSCFLALGMLGGRASTTEIRLLLRHEGEVLATVQVRSALHHLARREPPLAEIVKQGRAGFGQPNVWRLTNTGHALLAEESSRVPCGTGWPGA